MLTDKLHQTSHNCDNTEKLLKYKPEQWRWVSLSVRADPSCIYHSHQSQCCPGLVQWFGTTTTSSTIYRLQSGQQCQPDNDTRQPAQISPQRKRLGKFNFISLLRVTWCCRDVKYLLNRKQKQFWLQRQKTDTLRTKATVCWMLKPMPEMPNH